MTKSALTLGLHVRTGKAIAIVLSSTKSSPKSVRTIVAKTLLQVAFTFEEGAVYHACQELPLADAKAHLAKATKELGARARTEMKKLFASVDGEIALCGMGIKVGKPLPALEAILKAHPLVHTAEIEMYRTMFADAAEASGARVVRFDAKTLAEEIARKARVSVDDVNDELARIGKASGRPWTAEQKAATLAAWRAATAPPALSADPSP